MERKLISAFIAFTILHSVASGQESGGNFTSALNNINQEVLKAQLGFLSSEWMEGRKAGEKGELISSDYIASQLQLFGVAPGGDFTRQNAGPGMQPVSERTYFQNFFLVKTSPGNDQEMSVLYNYDNTSIEKKFDYNVDFAIRIPDENVEIQAPVVFAGYGFRSEKLRYDDFGKLDLKGKFVLVISGYPGFAKDQLSVPELNAATREAETIARQKGAIGLIEINPGATVAGPRSFGSSPDLSPSERRPVPSRIMSRYSLQANEGKDTFVRISITGKTGDEIIKDSGISLQDFIKKSETRSSVPLPVVKGKSIRIKTSVNTELVRVRNVIGIIEGNSKDEFIVIGAHYDHMGTSEGYIWNGADDNGSGTVGVMTIAKAIKETGVRPDKTIIIALWTAEEEGLLGSRYYVRNLPYPKQNYLLNVNFDMISRYIADTTPDKVTMTYNDNLPVLRTITENNLQNFKIKLDVDYQPSDNPPGGSDHRSFVEAGIPVMRFKPGHREEYHTPYDETGTIDWEIMEKIVKISFADIWELANSKW